VQRLNAIGVAALSRAVMQHPPAGVPTTESSNPLTTKDAIGVETVAIGLAILEVTLLAGAAFAVGARRQRHDLALVAAAGGDAGTVRSVVLAGGLVLGVIGAVIGVGLGLALAPAALPFVVHHSGHRAGHFDVRPWEIAGIGVLGVVTGVLAAVLPARSAAREDVVLALSGRRGILRTARRIPAIGVVMIVAGVVIAVAATHNFHFRVILAGAVVAELGFAICAPSLIGVVGRLGRYVSLAPRLALRDAARHRGRSGPAVAAIMAAVAGSIAVSAFFTTSEHDRRADYVASARIGQPYLETTARPGSAAWAQYADVLRHDLGAEGVVPVTRAACVRVHTRCAQFATFSSATSATDIAVGNASMLDVLTGHTDAGAVRALSDGEIVLFDPTRDLPATITDETPTLFVALERASIYHDVIGRSGTPVAGLMTPATAHLLGIRTAPAGMVGLTSTMPTAQQEDRAFEQLPSRVALILDRGYHSNIGVGLLVLALAAAIVTLGATAVAVGLSMAESKPDLITLSAVGGRPVTRRLLVASQAGTVAVLGAAEGVIAGLIPAWAILRSLNRPDFILPWTTIGVVVVGIPLLAMLGTAAFAGSRLTLDRRVS
jgi:putative ABC transport system permease protein